MISTNYIIVTPCRNEAENLPQLAESIINNTITPILWVIFNDGSTDGTAQVAHELQRKYDWIDVIDGEIASRDLGFHYAKIVDRTIKNTLDKCKSNNISIEYIGLIDADMVLDFDFFEKIIRRFEENPNMGVSSGTVAYLINGVKKLEQGRSNHPIGGLRVWRTKCFEDTGGFPQSYSADSVSNVLAMLHGWDTIKYDDIVGVELRKTSSAEGFWKGFMTRGESDYYRDYHPIYVIFKSVKYSLTKPYYRGIAYIYAYIRSALTRMDKIDLLEVRKYYRKKHREIIDDYVQKVKSRF
ncbi:glycosyltransferase family 2 protein [Methanococcoides alaskense]|uniref:Glycosyltransferase involved in cell wall biosynthesis n=1 Tax=Methanococcoides alaskense TaxID=325778 RepID=A0AA90Z8B5_9EURY|nr:glycosyltransferase family 2 protein [Methanococcoides alaskense]MDA0524403.1 glycosyltransferase family 2 protein [Methanococcoides alaskense]MDR6223220.1 glycosyltransferase involved in cell wall biosynthesis [Methanococcoides alaskense]